MITYQRKDGKIISYKRPSSMGAEKPVKLKLRDKELQKKSKDIINEIIYKRANDLVNAGLSNALGKMMIFKIDAFSKKPVLLTDEKEIQHAFNYLKQGGIDPDGKFFFITTKEPETKAVELLWNRAYGKPKESLDVSGEVQFSLKALAEHRKALEVEAKIVEDDDNIILPPAEQNK